MKALSEEYGGMRSSYAPGDVEILLKDITGLEEPLPASVREKKIQGGMHYCEMLPLEYRPTGKYMRTYEAALRNYAEPTAAAAEILAEKLYRRKGGKPVLVSLARAGIPVGILLKHSLQRKYGISVPHYAVSIIRGRGIDANAMEYILKRHEGGRISFVDGWIGKGAILRQLEEAVRPWPSVGSELGVLSDPAGLTDLCGTHEDILIPSSCLNATVTGLISRTFLREDIIGPDDFHGAAYYAELEGEDLSRQYLECIERYFGGADAPGCGAFSGIPGTEVVKEIAREYGVRDINFIKPGIGESTRVLLRRIPWQILVNPEYAASDELAHIYQLAEEKGVPCVESRVKLGNYKVCGLIRQLSDL